MPIQSGKELVELVLNHQLTSMSVGFILGWILTHHYYKKSREDSDRFIATLRSDNESFKQQLQAVIGRLPAESEKKLTRIRKQIVALDTKPNTTKHKITVTLITLVPWVLLWGYLFAAKPEGYGGLVFLSLFPGFIVFSFLWVIADGVLSSRSLNVLSSQVLDAINAEHLDMVEKDYLKRWVRGHPWSYLAPAFLLQVIEENP